MEFCRMKVHLLLLLLLNSVGVLSWIFIKPILRYFVIKKLPSILQLKKVFKGPPGRSKYFKV